MVYIKETAFYIIQQNTATCLLHAGFLLRLLFNPVDGGDIFSQNVVRLSQDYMPLYP
jgi:hypothetical protein